MNEDNTIPENLPRTLFMVNCYLAESREILRRLATDKMSPDEVQHLSQTASGYVKFCEDKLEEIVEGMGGPFGKIV